MKTYSEDLRTRMADTCGQSRATRQQVADRFGVSLSFVTKLLRHQRTGGGRAPKPTTGGRARCLDAAARALFVARVGRQPNVTLAELLALLVAKHGQIVCLGVVWRVLAEHDLRRKKNPPRHRTRHAPRRSPTCGLGGSHDPTHFKFVDETGLHLAFARRYGRAPGGQHVGQGVPLRVGTPVTLVGALTVNALGAVMNLDGA